MRMLSMSGLKSGWISWIKRNKKSDRYCRSLFLSTYLSWVDEPVVAKLQFHLLYHYSLLIYFFSAN